MASETDFFESQFGNYYDLPIWRQRRMGALTDLVYDARLQLNRSYRQMRHTVPLAPIRNVLITGVEVPARSQFLRNAIAELSKTRHRITTKLAPMREGNGKFQNINFALRDIALEDYDWLVVIDDDIAIPDNFLDTFIYLAERANLKLCQPAHRFRSYQSYAITQREWNSLARVTHFVECGPITALNRQIFPHIVPFADLRWAWGTDVAWSEIARKHDLRIGIIDGTPIEHLRPVAASYSGTLARAEGIAYLEQAGVHRKRTDILRTVEVISSL